MNITMIVAHDNFMGIGLKGGLPWNKPSDLAHFKKTTENSAVIVGHNTYKTLPKLPNRSIIVVSNDMFIDVGTDHLVNDLDDALILANDLTNTDTVYIIGGARMYKQYHNYYTHLIVSHIRCDYSIADTKIYDYNENNEFQASDTDVLEDDVVVVTYTRRNKPPRSII